MAVDVPWPEVTGTKDERTKAGVVIIGGGISGMCMAIDLLRNHRTTDFIVVEKGGGFGGTWRDNTFPGSCCDVWSHLYCYSFNQNADWTRDYPGQREILAYLVSVAQKYELYKYSRFNTSATKAEWDEVELKWKTTVQVEGGKDSEFGDSYTIESDFVVAGVGQLSAPRYPKIPGLNSFKGKTMHSARWDWSYSLENKRVAVIGTGATAAQIVPEVAKVARHLTVLQRSPGWVVPRHDSAVPRWRRDLLRYFPLARWLYRARLMNIREQFHKAVTQNASPAADHMRHLNHDLLHNQLPDRADLREMFTPKFSPGCKRSVISDDYYPTFNKPNVSLETRNIEEVTAKGIRFEGENDSEEFDLIILATGFHSQNFLHPIEIAGLHGRALTSIWPKGVAKAYRGVSIEDLPNFATLYGPNSNLTHNSLILVIEAQVRYVSALIKEVLAARSTSRSLAIVPRTDRVTEYNEDIQQQLQKSSFADALCTSWWKTDDGTIPNNWPGSAVDYQISMAEVPWTDYIAIGSGSELVKDKPNRKIGRVVEELRFPMTALKVSTLCAALVALRWFATARSLT